MKHLILIRHAKSSWDNPQLDDLKRPLNKRGKYDAPLMGKRLKSLNIIPDLIISSPAKRAYKTAKKIAKQIDFPINKITIKNEMYLQGTRSILKLVNELDEKFHSVYLVGHNPDITSVAYTLTHHHVENIPTCGIFYITFDKLFWQDITKGSGTFKQFDYPKNHY